MPVLRNIGALAVCPDTGGQDHIGLVRDGALAWQEDEILWAGADADLPEAFQRWPAWDADGGLVVPGLIDCHTHLVFGGWRAGEFEQRVRGAAYLDIARAGGGIRATVGATRAASHDELYEKASPVLDTLATLGVTCLECKSGYGLTLAHELKQLEVIRDLGRSHPLELVPTFLGAHVPAPEYAQQPEDYVRVVVEEMLPEVAAQGLATSCDVFLEQGAFSYDQARRVLERAGELGLRSRVHADQLSDGGGAGLAAALGALSADHLEQASDAGLRAMAEAGVVGVTLPLASLYTFQPPLDARRLVDAGVPVAVSTDFNPGSAPSYHLPMAMHLACPLNRLTPAQVLKGATIYAARALGKGGDVGSLEPGKQADFALFDAPDVDHWMYHFQARPAVMTVKLGEPIHGAVHPLGAH